MHMKSTEQFADLMCCDSVAVWRNLVFKLGTDLGYEQTLLAILPDRNTPVEAEYAFLHSNYSDKWLGKYTAEKMHHVDPAFTHCTSKSIPLIWSPDIFSARGQKEMYEEACGHGLRSGVTLPIHGALGEMGILCFVTDAKPGKCFQQEAHNRLPELSYFRDFIFETSLRFMKPAESPEKVPPITRCELECLKWCAAGKSSRAIAQILNCSVATVDFHFTNLRNKFNVSSRLQVVAKALLYGLINL
jgi:LuxR family quorum-sensing transcriptional regulator LasR